MARSPRDGQQLELRDNLSVNGPDSALVARRLIEE